MTYLLTEVALGVLGLNFYNIEGAADSPCLSERRNLGLEEDNSTKLHLTDIMKQDMAEAQNGNTENKSKFVDLCTSTNESLNPTQNKKLSKLLDFERTKLREQIKRHKTAMMAKYSYGHHTKEAIVEFINKERENLKEELKIVKEFRHNMENTVKALDGEVFKNYLETFNNSPMEHNTIAPDDIILDMYP